MPDLMVAAHAGQRVTNHMIDELVAAEVQRREMASATERAAELQALRAQVDIRRDREQAYYRDKIDEARALYGHNPRHSLLGRAAWGLIGLAVEKVLGPLERGE